MGHGLDPMSTARLPLIDEKGNIFLHGQEDLQLLVNFTEPNTAGRTMFFIIEGIPKIPVPAVAETPNSRVIAVPQATIAKIPEGGANYALRDETEFPHFVRLDGKIRWYGWVK
jgi:hypothetical protein